MSKIWPVAEREYRRNVFSKGFILAILSVPLMITVAVVVGTIASRADQNTNAIGYVDLANWLLDPVQPPRRGGSPDSPSVPKHVPLIAYPTEQAARAALEAGEIQAYYVVTANYALSKQVEMVYFKPPDPDATSQFWDFLQINVLAPVLPPHVAERAVAGSNLIVRWPDDAPGGGREFSQRTFLNTFAPPLVGVAVVALLLMSSGYLMGAVAEEKENRMVEVLSTSLSPGQLMRGKIVGILGVTLTQLAAWVAFAAVAILLGRQVFDVAFFHNLSIQWSIVLKMLLLAAPAFVMFAALMVTVGATVVDVHEGQQVMALLIQPFMVPLWLMQPLIEHSDSPLSLGLSLFPLTALPSLSLRIAFTQVPVWQIALSAGILALCAAGALWLAGRAFRLGMLRYGQRLNWREIFKRKT